MGSFMSKDNVDYDTYQCTPADRAWANHCANNLERDAEPCVVRCPPRDSSPLFTGFKISEGRNGSSDDSGGCVIQGVKT